MTDPTLTISIDRSSLPGSLAPLVFSAALDATPLGIVGYQPPADVPRYAYAPSSADVDGAELVAVAWEHTNLGFDWVADEAASEADVQTAYLEVRAALEQFSFPVTTQVDGAPAQVWTADRGGMNPSPRTYEDLLNHNPVYSVTIPVQPIPGSA